MTAKAIQSLLMGALLAGLVGCGPREKPVDPLESGRIMMRQGNEQRQAELAGKQFVQVRTVVVDVPSGPGSDSGIWDLVDESGTDPLRREALADNGMRVGIGRQEDWLELAACLEGLAGRKTEEVTSIVQPHELFSIAVKSRQPERTAFLIRPDGTLSGLDLPAGDYLLTMMSLPSPDDPEVIHLSCQPKVRSSRQYAEVTSTPGGPVVTNQHRLVSVGLMTYQTTIQIGQFILIGPSEQATRSSSVGHHLFVKDKAGLAVRTFFVLTPDLIEK